MLVVADGSSELKRRGSKTTITYLDKLPESLVVAHQLLVVFARLEMGAAEFPIGLQQFLSVRLLAAAAVLLLLLFGLMVEAKLFAEEIPDWPNKTQK